MILADKLNKLRTSSGLSQEQLAERMNVSRQSISKWESGSSIPTMDKIVELSNIYGISTDYLLKDEMEELPSEVVADFDGDPAMREVSIEEAQQYIQKMENVKNRTALGVFLCILSPVILMVFLGMSMMPNATISENMANAVGVGVLLVIVATAVAIFILTSIDTNQYEFLEKEEFRLSYGVEGILKKAQDAYRPTYYKFIALGAALCVISTIPLIMFSMSEDEQVVDYMSVFGVAILLAIVACGVFFIVRVSMLYGAYDKLLQQGDYTKEKKKASKKLGTFSGAYWLILTAFYLLISFVTERWEMTWIVWPVGAVAFAAVYTILESVVGKKD